MFMRRKFLAGRSYFLPALFRAFLHHPREKSSHLVRRVLLHRRCDVSIGVQGKACAVVAQDAGKRFHVHAVLQGEDRERMPEIMEADHLQPGPFQDPVQHVQHAVGAHRSAAGRGEDIGAEPRLPFLLLPEHLDRLRREDDLPVGVLRFQRRLLHLAPDPRDLPLDVDAARGEVHVLPLDAQQLPAPQAGGQLRIVQLEHAAALRLREEGFQLVQRQRLHLRLLPARQDALARRIRLEQLLLDRLVQRVGDEEVHVADRLRGEALGLLLGFLSLHSPALAHAVVEELQVMGRQLLQPHFTDAVTADLVFEEALVVDLRRGTEIDLPVLVQPAPQPLGEGVLPCADHVHRLRFRGCLPELVLHLGLRFAEDVLDDALAVFVIPGGVAALPAPVLALADVALAVRSAFCHVSFLLW